MVVIASPQAWLGALAVLCCGLWGQACAQDVLVLSKDTVFELDFPEYGDQDSAFLQNTTADTVTVTSLAVEPLTSGMSTYYVEIHAGLEYYGLSSWDGPPYESYNPIRVPPTSSVRLYALRVDVQEPPLPKARAANELDFMDSIAVAIVMQAADQTDTLVLQGWYHWGPNTVYEPAVQHSGNMHVRLSKPVGEVGLTGRLLTIPAKSRVWRATVPFGSNMRTKVQ